MKFLGFFPSARKYHSKSGKPHHKQTMTQITPANPVLLISDNHTNWSSYQKI